MQSSEQWLQNLLLLTGVSTQVRANLETTPSSEQDVPAGESYWLTIDQTNLTSEQIRILIGAGGAVLLLSVVVVEPAFLQAMCSAFVFFHV